MVRMLHPVTGSRVKRSRLEAASVAAGDRDGYVAAVRRLVATFALVGLVTSPVVAHTRLFCKYTGVEITDCAERDTPAAPVVSEPGCCDHRTLSPLPASKVTADPVPALAPVVVVSAAAPFPSLVPAFATPWRATSAGAGPPLFVQHRSLLI